LSPTSFYKTPQFQQLDLGILTLSFYLFIEADTGLDVFDKVILFLEVEPTDEVGIFIVLISE
jgi:hypothetical protein